MYIAKLRLEKENNILGANFVRHNPVTDSFKSEFFKPPSHFLYYHVKGERKIAFHEDIYFLREGDIVLFLKEKQYLTPSPGKEYEAMNILFAENVEDMAIFEKGWFECSMDYIYIPFITNAKDDLDIKFLFEEVVRLSNSFRPLKKLKAQCLLKQILILLAQKAEHLTNKAILPVEFVEELVRKNPEKNYTIDELAVKLHLSRSTLTRTFKKAAGKSIKTYLLEMKINMAINMFKTNPFIKVREVAKMLGFADEYHFSNTFRKNTGMSPASYKSWLRPIN